MRLTSGCSGQMSTFAADPSVGHINNKKMNELTIMHKYAIIYA